jgi:hypothetical protein
MGVSVVNFLEHIPQIRQPGPNSPAGAAWIGLSKEH